MDLTGVFSVMQENTTDYLAGYIDGLTAYAWWKDGVQYVGTSGTTLTEAIIRAISENKDL